MKRKKILSILLASAMIGTAPASAWAADFTDTNVVDAEEVTEEATEEVTRFTTVIKIISIIPTMQEIWRPGWSRVSIPL